MVAETDDLVYNYVIGEEVDEFQKSQRYLELAQQIWVPWPIGSDWDKAMEVMVDAYDLYVETGEGVDPLEAAWRSGDKMFFDYTEYAIFLSECIGNGRMNPERW